MVYQSCGEDEAFHGARWEVFLGRAVKGDQMAFSGGLLTFLKNRRIEIINIHLNKFILARLYMELITKRL
jgi:hypothetical protein